MKIRVFLSIAICLLLNGCSNTVSRQEQMETFVADFLLKYPEATLQDIYKGNFQDKFGPAHLLSDREAVKNYILDEIKNAETLEGEAYQPCGWQSRFYQVNLSLIRDRKVSVDDFADAFMASANGIDTTLTASWLQEWEELQHATRNVSPNLKGFAEDSIRIGQLLKEGKYVVHHSRVFNQHYQPHYRIIRKDIFEKSILPKLKEKHQ